MNFIGRKLYLDWGDLVLAIEKLPMYGKNISFDYSIDRSKSLGTKLVDIYEILGERVERPIKGTIIPVNSIGYDVNHIVTDSSLWLSQEEQQEDARKLDEYEGKLVYVGKLGEAHCFYIGFPEYQAEFDQLIEWLDENSTDSEDYFIKKKKSVYIFNDSLAIKFKLRFGGMTVI